MRGLRGAVVLLGIGLAACAATPRDATTRPGIPAVEANDNRSPAGHLAGGTLSLRIEVGGGDWRPERALESYRVLAFAESGGKLTTPGPLIRVLENTRVEIAWHNPTDADLYIHGFGAHEPLRVGAHGDAATHFVAADAGTFYYWGSLKPDAELDEGRDSQLVGALVVDPASGAEDDRVFVIKRLGSEADGVHIGSGLGAWAINGRSWPDTERLTYAVGETVRWRLINATTHRHPMHLHGTYFRVTHEGDGVHDTTIPAERRQQVVTETMPEGATRSIEFSPERPGNWLFHCHVLFHVIPENRLHEPYWYGDYADLPHDQHMSGLVLGIHAIAAHDASIESAAPARQMTLHVAERAGVRYVGDGLDAPGLGYALDDGPVSAPGPILELERGRPVEIAIVNETHHATAVHWHGIELESYYDGVPHWGGDAQHVTPAILPGARFVARFTPPRAGTFSYHTHFNDYVQLAAGLYGALIVTEPGHPLSGETDHVFVLGQQGFDELKDPLLINGAAVPPVATWRAGAHRVRLVGITPNLTVRVRLTRNGAPIAWTPHARDGADLPDALRIAVPAEVDVSPGQTFDYDIVAEPGELRLEGLLDSDTKQHAVATLLVNPNP
jgi:FtsP/CotA-like multicopper oxidase with cupredoxin domain